MPEENVHHAAALTTLGAIRFRKGNYHDSLAAFSQALELTERFFGKNVEYAVTRHNLATVYRALGDLDAAIIQQRAAVEIVEDIFGSDHERARVYREFFDGLLANGSGYPE
jgi:tetratricopeptide (TPR) repeat protein